MPLPRYVGQRVIIDWGSCSGREGVVIEISQRCHGMVVVEYEAKVAQPLCGIEAGERVKAFLHWSNTKPAGPSRKP